MGRIVVVAVLSISMLIGVGVVPAGAQVDPGTQALVIAEIMYHPSTDPADNDIDDLEYIELHNPGTAPVPLAGYSWGAGVGGALPDVTVPAGGRVVVSPAADATESAYGHRPIAEYEGKLGNGGELVSLLSPSGDVVDEVNFDDKEPWPVAADGDGPSIELIDPALDNALGESWQASPAGGSPGAAPVVATSAIAGLTATPSEPGIGEAVLISASVSGVTSANLVYRVGFERERRVPMIIDGGRATATIPGQSAAKLVRYRIEVGGGLSYPPAGDSRHYAGYVVGAAAGTVPVLDVFVEDAFYQEMIGGSLFDRDRLFDVVVAYGGQVFDNAKMQVRGGTYARRNNPKQSFNIEMPDGYLLDAPELFAYPVDEFGIQAEYADPTKARAHASWLVMEQEGFAPVASHWVQVNRNGSFFGLYRLTEKLDGIWREQHGYDDGSFYKADGGWNRASGFAPTGFDQKDGEVDDPIIDEIRAIIAMADSPARTRALYDQFDIPNIVNYLALGIVLQHVDQNVHNFYVFHDQRGTGRVSLHPWDLDLTWYLGVQPRCGAIMTDPSCTRDPLYDTFWEVPEIREAVHRRIRSIIDRSVGGERIVELHKGVVEGIGPELDQLESDAWGRSTMATRRPWFDYEARRVVRKLDSLTAVPPSQPDRPVIVISEIHHSPAEGGAEFVELANPGSTAIDLSGWKLDGIGLGIPYGTVIPAGKRIVFTGDVAAFTTGHPGLGVAVTEFPGGLKGRGEELVLLNRDGAEIDRVSYGAVAPWPVEPADGVASLELVDLGSDNNRPGSWRASITPGGTPGQAPGAVPSPTPPPVPSPTPSPGSGPLTVAVRARGTTGAERIELRSGSVRLASFAVGTSYEVHSAEVARDALTDLRVVFVNNGTTSGRDRNVRIDYVEVAGVRKQSEDADVRSTGTYAGGSCRPGFKRSEVLHCNGAFELGDRFATAEPEPEPEPVPEPVPVPEPELGAATVSVRARGTTGAERIEIRTGAGPPAVFELSATYQNYSAVVPKSGLATLAIAFVNDGTTGGRDRNVRIDYVEVAGVRKQSEDADVRSTGTYAGGSCRPGFKRSEVLHCNGALEFGAFFGAPGPVSPPVPKPSPTPGPGSLIEVYATGRVGGEIVELSIDGRKVSSWTLNGEPRFYGDVERFERYVYAHPRSVTGRIKIAFVNNGGSGRLDRNIRVDAVVVDGVRYESEASTVYSTGTYRSGIGCRAGNLQTEFLHCNGYLAYQIQD